MKNPAAEEPYMGKWFRLIGLTNREFPNRYRTEFPMVCSCLKCHGIRDYYLSHEESELTPEQRRDLAYEIALVQHGYYLHAWEGQNVGNRYIFPRKCSCTCDHEWKEIAQPGNCLHTVKCTRCETQLTYDSSD
jgi:hypothetical protein